MVKVKLADKAIKKQKGGGCKGVQTLMQLDLGICYYVSMLHSMFFSKGMRNIIGTQIQYLESKWSSDDKVDEDASKWLFVDMWNKMEYPTRWVGWDWKDKVCRNLANSLVGSCKLLKNSGKSRSNISSQFNQQIKLKSGIIVSAGYNGFVTDRNTHLNADKGGHIGEVLKPILCTLEMKNVLFITVEEYDSSKVEDLVEFLSKAIVGREQERDGIDDIIAIRVESIVHVEDNEENKYKLPEQFRLNDIVYNLDSIQFQNKYDGTAEGHVIAGITCPYVDGDNNYPRLVLNSWKDNDVIETDWNNSHITIYGKKLEAHQTYNEALSRYNQNHEQSTKEGVVGLRNNWIFSASQGDCLYFYTREKTSETSKQDEERIKDNILTKAAMLLGAKPIEVNVNGDKNDMNNYNLEFTIERANVGKIKETLLNNPNLKKMIKKMDTKEENNVIHFVLVVSYKMFTQNCIKKLEYIENILTMTGKVPRDIIIDDSKTESGLRYVYFGVYSEIQYDVIEKLKEKQLFLEMVNFPKNVNTLPRKPSVVSDWNGQGIFEFAEREPQSVSVWSGDKMIERKLRPYLAYYKFDYDKYIALLELDQSGGKKKHVRKTKKHTK
jgi:hypothetical protein